MITEVEDLTILTGMLAEPLLPADEYEEPLHGSLVLTGGPHGTAWQRLFADGLWHSTLGHKPRDWERMLTSRNLVLVYDAPERQPVGDQS